MAYVLGVMTLLSGGALCAETLFVDVRAGNDRNSGTQKMPLKTIERAVEIINGSTQSGPSVIKIAAGVYELKKQCLIKNDRQYSKGNRLIIEAAVLPDDPEWRPESMPIVVSVESPAPAEDVKSYVEISGFKVEISHVTIRGLKFLGSPVPKVLYYPIFREGKDLNDLCVSQCMFLCDPHVITSNVAILANGHGLTVDHCVFYQCSNAVVFWNAEGGTSRGNVMTHCIVDGGYVSGVWLCQTDEDFEFHHNIITNCRYAWMRSNTNTKTYRLHDCIINNFEYYSGVCNPEFILSETGPEIQYIQNNVIKTGEIQLEKGLGLDMELPHRFMHVVRETPGYEMGAGLFHSNK